LIVGPAPGQAGGISWQEAVTRLAHERARAKTCVPLLKTYGDEVSLSQGDLIYSEVKAEVDVVIAGPIVALAKEDDPESLPDLERRLERGVKGREAFCEHVKPLVPDSTGEKNLVADLVAGGLGPTIEALKEIYLSAKEADPRATASSSAGSGRCAPTTPRASCSGDRTCPASSGRRT